MYPNVLLRCMITDTLSFCLVEMMLGVLIQLPNFGDILFMCAVAEARQILAARRYHRTMSSGRTNLNDLRFVRSRVTHRIDYSTR